MWLLTKPFYGFYGARVSPSPGGVGPVAVAVLLRHVLAAARRRRGLSDAPAADERAASPRAAEEDAGGAEDPADESDAVDAPPPPSEDAAPPVPPAAVRAAGGGDPCLYAGTRVSAFVIGVGGAPARAPILGALPRVTTPAKGRDQPARAAQHRRR